MLLHCGRGEGGKASRSLKQVRLQLIAKRQAQKSCPELSSSGADTSVRNIFATNAGIISYALNITSRWTRYACRRFRWEEVKPDGAWVKANVAKWTEELLAKPTVAVRAQ